MFHLYITLGYFIPAIYIYFRIKNLFINKGYRWIYSFIYILIAALAPFARFANNDMAGLRQLMILVSGYLVPFFLNLFLAILLYELFLLLNWGVKLVPTETRRNFKYKVYALSSIILLPVLVVIAGAINLNTIRTSEYTVEIPRRDSKLHRLKIAFVADFHLDKDSKMRFVNQYVKKINDIHPDILLYGGDIVEGRADNVIRPDIIAALKSIKTKYGSFGVLGNHEFYGSDDPGRLYPMIHTRLLRDEVIKIDNSFYLAGRVDQLVEERKPVKKILAKAASNLPVLIMDHRPTRFQEASRSKADIQFSGHTHNGQLFPLNLFLKNMYELSWGYKKEGNTHFFVTCGLRLWGPPVKTAGKSEIVVVNVVFR